MLPNILKTLRAKLLDTNGPERHQTEFMALSGSMFPGKECFIRFLGERHLEAQIENAKQILLRLSYQSSNPPPNKLLYNLLESETSLSGSASKTHFNGRDHFVHLANLYLLGLYVFWYHETIHKRIVEQFDELIESSLHHTRIDRRIQCARLFLDSWTTFVLYHDLGYPCEIASQMERPEKYITPFSDVYRYSAKDTSLFILSQMLALIWVKSEEPFPTVGRELRGIFGRRKSPSAQSDFEFNQAKTINIDDWRSAVRIPQSTGAGLWKLLSKIVPPKDCLVVLESVTDGSPIASTNSELHNLIPSRSRNSYIEELKTSGQLIEWASINELPSLLSGKFHWVVYINNLEVHTAAYFKKLFDNQTETSSDFEDFAGRFLSAFAPTNPDADEFNFDDFGFEIYLQLISILDFEGLDSDQHSDWIIHAKIRKSETKNLRKLLLDEVSGVLQNILTEKSEKMAANGRDVGEIDLETYLSELLDGFGDANPIASAVYKKLSHQIKERIDLKSAFYSKYYISIKNNLLKRTKGSGGSEVFKWLGGRGRGKKFYSADTEMFSKTVLAQETSKLFGTRRLDNIQTVLKYSPRWAKGDKDFLDHGVASGLLFAETCEAKRLFRATENNDAISEILSIRDGPSGQGVDGKSNKLACEALYAVLIHNIYPKEFILDKHKKFRTLLDRDEAFSYLALLCDSLQPWDRKRLFNQATGSPPYSTYAEQFDVQVEGRKLLVSERGDKLRVSEREKSLRGYLDCYLTRASEFVFLSLTEWELRRAEAP